jgi:hypothetical protein
MKNKIGLIVIIGLISLALAPVTHAECTQSCEEVDFFGMPANAIFWGTDSGGGEGRAEVGIGRSALKDDTGYRNVAIGDYVMSSNNNGSDQVGVGAYALIGNTIGSNNTAVGSGTLYANTTGNNNTAIGDGALGFNTQGSENTATGAFALLYSTGNGNTATGYLALNGSFDPFSTGKGNTATGHLTLCNFTTGSNNTATGREALMNNTSGSLNTAIGDGSLHNNTTANYNTAVGSKALHKNTTGVRNTAVGDQGLFKNTTGFDNTAMGGGALINNSTGFHNIAVGINAGTNLTTGAYNIDIGNDGVAAEANTIRIGKRGEQTNAYIVGINGVTVAGGIGVLVDSSGHLGTSTSSARFKENIQPMDKASEAIRALQPVTFRYKKELDPKGILQFGLVAEQVEKVNPDLVARDDKGKPYSVRYEAVNAMLLNEFLKEHRRNEQQQGQIEALKKALTEQTAQMQKVTAQLAAIQAAPRLITDE